MTKNFYLTTTLPYVNAEPHIGFALEIVQADVVARFKKLEGFDVFFNFGTDEHGLKIFRKALEVGKDPQKYADEYTVKFEALKSALNLSYNNFIRTTDPHHIKAAQEFWKKCDENGDIYKKSYKIKYCVGCELEKTESELTDGKCPIHPNQEIEIIDEENYFFSFSKYQQKLLDLYKDHPEFVVPTAKLNEIKSFVEGGLEDFSISRLKSKLSWGVDVPGDPDHIMYVWFDALVNYVSAVGWPEDQEKFKSHWPVVQFAGKDNLRQQSAIWQAMLFSAGLPPSKQIFIHGFITANGQKISKSLGNVIDPIELTKKYGTDALRYYLLSKIHPWEDSDFTYEKFEETYNADLANGLGNLISRSAKLLENSNIEANSLKLIVPTTLSPEIPTSLNKFRFDEAIRVVNSNVFALDKYISEKEPWKTTNLTDSEVWINIINQIRQIGYDLKPFLPTTSEQILEQFGENKIKSRSPLFPRITNSS